jgi:SAM-dependent methyltransferase
MSPPSQEAWQNLDAARDSLRLVEFLGQFAELPNVRAAKRSSFEFLQPCAGAHLLDAGCGGGQDLLTLLSEVLPGGKVVGVDSSARALLEARARTEGRHEISLEQADVTALPFPDGRFDGSRADRTLIHVSQPELALAELVRVTRPGGRVVISETMVLNPHPRETQRTRRRQAQDALAFVPFLLGQLGVEDVFVDRSEASLELPPSAAEVIGTPDQHVSVRFVHVGGTVGERG